MRNNLTDAIASIMAILRNNNLTELAFGDYDELNDPTYVFWWDNHGTPYEDPVIKIALEDDDLAVEVEARDFGNVVTLSSSDIDHEEWWRGIRDNMLGVLQRAGQRRCPACGKVLAGEDEYCSDECRLDLNRYYRENKDSVHSSIMELASDLAAGRLMNAHGRPSEAFIEPDDPDDPENGTHYKKEFQDEFNRREDEPEDFPMQLSRLVDKAHAWQREARSLIIETLRRNSGRISFLPQNPEERPVAASLYGHEDFPRVDLTDVYIEEGVRTYIMADGIDTETGCKRTGFQIQDEQLYDIALFLNQVV